MSVKPDVRTLTPHALSLAPAGQVALGDAAASTAAAANALQADAMLATERIEQAPEAEEATGMTLTCAAGAELRLNWSVLPWWLEQS